jgi:hypothetical protein
MPADGCSPMRLRPSLVVLLLLAPAALAIAPGLTAVDDAPAADAAAYVASAQAILHGKSFLGNDPQGWMDFAGAQLNPTPSKNSAKDLVAAMGALYQAAGVVPTDAQQTELLRGVAQLDTFEAAALAPLVSDVARVYASQVEIAKQVDVSVLMEDGVLYPSGHFASAQIHQLEADFDEALSEQTRIALPPEAARASVANAQDLIEAAKAFEVAVGQAPPGSFEVLFTDPLGLVQIGSRGADSFVPGGVLGQPVLVADPGGDDIDTTNAGGACPLDDVLGQFNCNGLAASLRVDVAGNDVYNHAGSHQVAQGSGALGGVGVLVDFTGSDTYNAVQTTTEGEFMYYFAAGVQGAGEGGVGILLDGEGNDRYLLTHTNVLQDAFVQSQGFGGIGGVGALIDGVGDDHYESILTCPVTNRALFCGMYILGTSLYGGVSIAFDGAGNDYYRGYVDAPQEDYYSQSFAAFGGIGIEVDVAGNDIYLDTAITHGPRAYGPGSPSLNCAYASAMYAGAYSLFLDLQGNDNYWSETIDLQARAKITSESYSLAGVSLFWDAEGSDVHRMKADGATGETVLGRGFAPAATDTIALYLDTGGLDIYQDFGGPTVGGDGSGVVPNVWHAGANAGIDVNLIPNV